MSTIAQEIGRKNVTHIRKAVTPDGMSIVDRVFFAVPYGKDATENGWKTAKEVAKSFSDLTGTQVHPCISVLAKEGSIIGRLRNGKHPQEFSRAFKTKRKTAVAPPSTTHRPRTSTSAKKEDPITAIEEAMEAVEQALVTLRQQQSIFRDLQKVLNN